MLAVVLVHMHRSLIAGFRRRKDRPVKTKEDLQRNPSQAASAAELPYVRSKFRTAKALLYVGGTLATAAAVLAFAWNWRLGLAVVGLIALATVLVRRIAAANGPSDGA